jgi:hypothetical protein
MINFYVYFYRADSFTWNPHKLMSVHLQCSAILLRHSVCRIEKLSRIRELCWDPDILEISRLESCMCRRPILVWSDPDIPTTYVSTEKRLTT